MAVNGHTYDTLLELKDAGAVTASARAQVGGAAKILDVGDGEFRGDLIIEVSAMDIASNDEIYDLILQGSPDAAFGTAGNIQELVQVSLSAKEVKRSDSDKDDVIGRIVLPFTNRFMGTNYRYLSLYHAIAGTTTSINYTARIGQTN